MIKANVKFFGREKDDYGVPKPYHSYIVVSSPWQTKDSGVASVIPLSSDSPTPNPPHKFTTRGGEEEAYNQIVEALRHLFKNEGLHELINKE